MDKINKKVIFTGVEKRAFKTKYDKLNIYYFDVVDSFETVIWITPSTRYIDEYIGTYELQKGEQYDIEMSADSLQFGNTIRALNLKVLNINE